MGCFVVARFLLTSTLCGPPASAELLVIQYQYVTDRQTDRQTQTYTQHMATAYTVLLA